MVGFPAKRKYAQHSPLQGPPHSGVRDVHLTPGRAPGLAW